LGVQTSKLIRVGVGSLGYLVLLVVVYTVHAKYLPVDVVFYSALLDVLLAAVAASVMLWSLRWFAPLGAFEKLQLAVIWLLAGYALAITVPTVIDRSLSFYLLEKLVQRGGAIRQDAFATLIADEYMREHRLVDVRLTEQLESGTIVIRDGCVVLTDRGRRAARFSRAFRTGFLPRHRLLMGEYSASLTDPFARSAPHPDYACRP
jgi:hypothetical protein